MAEPPSSTAAIVTPKPTPLALAALAAPPRPARTLYFAYGSDMQISYMARTCPNSRYIGRAVLTDYKWHINGLGFANLTKVKTAHAPGLVFEVDDTDKASLEEKRFPLYKSVTVDAELYPAPFCLYRRQATWITKHGGPEAVLEEAYATGRGNDRRASYTERGILVFISQDVTVDGRPDARYAEAINAAAADAMALGIEPLFFEKIVQQFMPGRMLPYLRVVRRGRTGGTGPIGSASPVPLTSASLAPLPSATTTTTTTDEKTTTTTTTPTTTTTDKPRGSTDSLRPGRSVGAALERERSRSAEKEKEKEKEKESSPTTTKDSGKEKATSGLSETIRSMFNRQRGRRKESNESAESSSAVVREAAGGRRSPLLTGSESGNASSDDNANSPSTDRVRKPAVPARPPRFDDEIYRPQDAQSTWAKRILSGNSSGPIRGSDIVVAGGSSSSTNRHSKSQSESSLVDTRPPAPKITISGPSRHNTMERDGPSRKYGTDGDNDNDSDSEVEKPSPLTTAATATTTSSRRPSGPRARQFVISPPPRPANPPPERAAGSSNISALSGGYTPIYASQSKNRSADSVLPAVTVGTVRRDTSGWEKGSSSNSGTAGAATNTSSATSGTTSSRLKAAKPPGKKRPSTDEVLRARAAAYSAFTADMAVNNTSSPVEAAAFIAAAERARNEFAADVDIKELTERTRQIAKSIVDKETAKDKEKENVEKDDDSEQDGNARPPPPSTAPPPPPREAPAVPLEKPKPVEVETESEDEDEESTEEAESSPEPESVPVPVPVPQKPSRPTRVPTVPKPTPTPGPVYAPSPVVRLPYTPRRPLRFHNAQKAAAAASEKERVLRRPKSFCTSSRSVSRFDRFLLQAAEHPHFAAKPWLPAFRGRHQYHLHGQHSHFQSHHYGHAHGHGHGHGHHFFGHSHTQLHVAPRRMVFTQTMIVSSMPRERRMSF